MEVDDINKLNACLYAGLKNPDAQIWIDKCFDMITDFEDGHSKTKFPEETARMIGRLQEIPRADILKLYLSDLHYQLTKNNLF